MRSMHFDLLVLGGTVVTGLGTCPADIGMVEGRIAEIGSLGSSSADTILDARGLHIFPGVIDTQVHFREPGMTHKEDLESGTRAAVMGGVTTVFEMPNTNPPTTSAEALADKLVRCQGRAWCDYAFFVGASGENVDKLSTLEMLPGTPGIKIFMGSSTGTLLVEDDEVLRSVLKRGIRRCSIHAEDEARLRTRKPLADSSVQLHPVWRDPEAARLATERILRLCEETGRPVHVLHISTLDELPLLAESKRRGSGATCEVTPQHLWFAAPDCYETLGTRGQMNPPIRSGEHRAALRAALMAGLFDVIGSDHAPHTLEEKALPYPQSPSGMAGVQTLLPVMITLCLRDQLISLERLVQMTSENPANLFGIANKGKVEPGFDADLAVVDLHEFEVTEDWLQSKCGWSPYEGERLLGRPVHTVIRGKVVVEDGTLRGEPGGLPARFNWKEG